MYISSGLKTVLRFSSHLQPVDDWLTHQAETVHTKTVCWGTVLRLYSLHCDSYMFHFPLHIF